MEATDPSRGLCEELAKFIRDYQLALTTDYQQRFSDGKRSPSKYGGKKRQRRRRDTPGYKLELMPHEKHLSQVKVDFSSDEPQLLTAVLDYLLDAFGHIGAVHVESDRINFSYAAFGTDDEATELFAQGSPSA